MRRRTEAVSVPITARALIQRLNRRLRHDNAKLCATRSNQDRPRQGDYYIVDLTINGVVGWDVDPEALGRELGALQPWERVVNR
jgi:hypothetical protein